MVSIPAVKAGLVKDYVFFIGDPIRTVSLWKRYGEPEDAVPEEYTAEYPIYANTRGQGVWNTEEPGETNQETVEPTDAFWNAVWDIRHNDSGSIDVEDCEWYEREVIQSLLHMLHDEATTVEMGGLFAYAERVHREQEAGTA